MYKLKYTPDAEADLRKLKKSEPSAFKKAVHLLNEPIVKRPRRTMVSFYQQKTSISLSNQR